MAKIDLAKLVVRLEAQTEKYQAELVKANQKLDHFTKQQDRNLDKVDKRFSAVGGVIKKFGGIIAGAFAVGRLVSFGRAAIQAAGQLQDLSERMGLTVEQLDALADAGREWSVEVTALEPALAALQGRVREALGAGREHIKITKDLGLSFRDAKGNILGTPELLEHVAKAIAATPDPAQKALIALGAFGESGKRMIPILETLADDGLQGLIDKGKTAGTVMGSDVAKAADGLGTRWDVLTDKATTGLTPMFVAIGDVALGAAEKAVQAVQTSLDAIDRLFDDAVTADDRLAALGYDAETMKALQRQLGEAPTIKLPKGTPAPFPADTFAPPSADVTGLVAATDQAEKAMEKFTTRVNFAKALLKTTDATLDAVIAKETEADAKAAERLEARVFLAKTMVDDASAELDRLVEEADKKFDLIGHLGEELGSTLVRTLADFFIDPAKEGLAGLEQAFIDTFKRIAAEAAILAIFDLIKQASGAKEGGFLDKVLSKVFRAHGGPVEAGQVVIPHGTEMFIPRSAGRIEPMGNLGGLSLTNNVSVAPGVSRAEMLGAMTEANRALMGALATQRRQGRGVFGG